MIWTSVSFKATRIARGRTQCKRFRDNGQHCPSMARQNGAPAGAPGESFHATNIQYMSENGSLA